MRQFHATPKGDQIETSSLPASEVAAVLKNNIGKANDFLIANNILIPDTFVSGQRTR